VGNYLSYKIRYKSYKKNYDLVYSAIECEVLGSRTLNLNLIATHGN